MSTTPTAFMLAERTATLIALIQVFGAAIFRVRVAGPLLERAIATGAPVEFAARLEAATKRVGAVAGTLLIALAAVRLHGQVVALFDGWHNVGAPELRALVLHSTWGHAWLLQLGAAAVISVGVFIGRPLDAWMAVPLAVSAALNGHPASVEGLAPLAVGMNAMHILAAGGWVGGVFFVFVATALATGPGDLLLAVRGFNRVALTCASIVVATGAFAAYVHVGSLHALFSSVYGTQLIVKLCFVFTMAAFGAWNWRRGTPALAEGNAAAIRRGVAGELFFALAIVVATARLVVLTPPTMGP